MYKTEHQERLAEYADLSLFSIIDIERRRTWVSDKTLPNIARALNMEAYQLLIPPEREFSMDSRNRERQILERITALLRKNQSVLRKTIDKDMEDIILRIVQIRAE